MGRAGMQASPVDVWLVLQVALIAFIVSFLCGNTTRKNVTEHLALLQHVLAHLHLGGC